MTCRIIVAACVVLALIGAPLPAAAQVADEAGQWRAVVERMEPAALVSVHLKDGTRFKGTLLSAQETTFTVKARTRIPVAARTVPYDAIVSLERTTVGMSPAKKVLIGVATGAGAAVVMVAVLIAAAWD